MARRISLVQVGTSMMTSYLMQTFFLPQPTIKGIDRLNRNFIWGPYGKFPEIHALSWDKLYQKRRRRSADL
ncbi:Uncharacterized protein TCM_002068 [Theobroma cacao]|uniref:Uncharacterized protein n=1 Tax=Theobroma cacao TaxID=3641 RepID=A0A061DME8_THECC|nr:Uncharacterized protein TCM_002068 [Theobroma cacao]